MEQLLINAGVPQGSAIHDAVVATDLGCRTCGYNLRTLAWSARCPECGSAVDASRLPADCPFGSYNDVQRARKAVFVLISAVALLTFAALLGTAILVAMQLAPSPAWSIWPYFGFMIRQYTRSAGYAMQAVATLLFLPILGMASRGRKTAFVVVPLVALGAIAAFPWRTIAFFVNVWPYSWLPFALNGVRELIAFAAILALVWILRALRLRTAAMRANRWSELLRIATLLLFPELLSTLTTAIGYFIRAAMAGVGTASRGQSVQAIPQFLKYFFEWGVWWRLLATAPAWLALCVTVSIACSRLNRALRPPQAAMRGPIRE